MNDWLVKFNYVVVFRMFGVKMCGVIGGNYDG